MKVLIACEFSGTVRRGFRMRGHDAWSADLLPAEDESEHHIQCGPHLSLMSVILGGHWDLLIGHPPCTYLCNSGVRWLFGPNGRGSQRNPDRWQEMVKAAEFFNQLLNAPVNRIAIENPIQHRYARQLISRSYDQVIQPWQFGCGEIKNTCLWLQNLPRLHPTIIVEGRRPRIHWASPGPERWKERSRTIPGIAEAMAIQWGNV